MNSTFAVVSIALAAALCASFMTQSVPSGSVGMLSQGGFVVDSNIPPTRMYFLLPYQSLFTIEVGHNRDIYRLNSMWTTSDNVPVPAPDADVWNHVNTSNSDALMQAWLSLRHQPTISFDPDSAPSIKLISENSKVRGNWDYESSVLQKVIGESMEMVFKNNDFKCLTTQPDAVAEKIREQAQRRLHPFDAVFIIDRIVLSPVTDPRVWMNTFARLARKLLNGKPAAAMVKSYKIPTC
jgi:hypothetical protein